MNLFPFGTQGNKETEAKKQESEDLLTEYEQRLAEYREALRKYKGCLKEYSIKSEGFDRKLMENQLSAVQTSIDLAYLKKQADKSTELLTDLKNNENSLILEQSNKLIEQGNKILTQQESLMEALINSNLKLEGLDNDMVGRISNVLAELQNQTLYQYKQNHMEQQSNYEVLSKAVKHNRVLLRFLFIFGILGLGAAVFIILYLLEIVII